MILLIKSQQNAQNTNQVLKWIPYNRFKNIEYFDKGGFSIIYKAVWLDSPVHFWSNNEKKWIRFNEKTVALKSFNKPSNLSKGFLNEVWNNYFIFSFMHFI